MNRHFTEEDLQISHKHIERCSTSLAIREMKIKTTMIYHYTPIRIAKIKKRVTTSNSSENTEKLSYTLLVGM